MTSMQQKQQQSYLSASDTYLENLYETYLKDQHAVPEEWRTYFDALPRQNGHQSEESHADIRNYFAQIAKQPRLATTSVEASSNDLLRMQKQAQVFRLINAYRCYGHHQAQLDPLNMATRLSIPALHLDDYHLTSADLDTAFYFDVSFTGQPMRLREIIQQLERTYCGTFAIEYMHITDDTQTRWLQEKVESVQATPALSVDEKKRILHLLTAAEGLEKYLGAKYVGQKRFSLEGGDSLIPLLDILIQAAIPVQAREVVIGMAHRGRLNVLVNTLGKPPAELFEEFEGKIDKQSQLSGDVKYHKGFSSDVTLPAGKVHLTLAFNPSHLEIIDPVVEGTVRARQTRLQDETRTTVIPILIHGDAAFAGQGVVMETLNLSQAQGYSTGGTVHIVVNNQIGFTTSNPIDSRSTLYCTDVAKMVQAPILHVNADDPEAVAFAGKLALDFRTRFKKDIVIDLVCYRRHGHNEADDASMTQPTMYENIKKHPTPRELYAKHLIAANVLSEAATNELVQEYRQALDAGKTMVRVNADGIKKQLMTDWRPYLKGLWRTRAKTGLELDKLQSVWKTLEKLPDGFTVHPQVEKLLLERKKMAAGELPMNWGFAEIMAYATLLSEGFLVRLSGQDCGRGTFAHRHAVLHDYKTAQVHVPLEQLAEKPHYFSVIDSVLSEEAVLGFEYGYASADPKALILWEAQFGDFANGAQVVIDQFISSGEQKWGRFCGLVMLLPHGYEGQGPEHSSARLERYLQLSAQQNIQVCVPTTPAQHFHLLRRQVLRPYRKPLIVMTPKSLLRHKLAVSSIDELVRGEFQLILPECDDIKPKSVTRVVLCAGKVYYDLLQKRRDVQRDTVAIVRVEQLYPFPDEELVTLLKQYPNATEIIWCQEEPQNQGAWYSIQSFILECLSASHRLAYAGRGPSASPAAGSVRLHNEEQTALIHQAIC